LEAQLAESRRKLLAARSHRQRPRRDDKVLAGWNGLMIESLARAAAVLDEPRYYDAAALAADFLLTHLRDPQGRLLRSWRRGAARFPAYLEDYASLANALVSLYEARFEERRIDEATGLVDEILRQFVDADSGGFFTTAVDHEPLVARKKDMIDGSLPSGGGLAVMALVRLGKLCGRGDYVAAAESALRAAVPIIQQSPTAMGQMLLALDLYLGPTPEVVVLGSADHTADREVLAELHRRYVPNKVVAFRDGPQADGRRAAALAGIFQGKRPIPPGPTVFVCEPFTCQAPVTGREAALSALESLARGPT